MFMCCFRYAGYPQLAQRISAGSLEILVRGPERENGCYVTMHPATSLQHCLRIAEESGCGKHILKVKKITIHVQAWVLKKE